MTTRCGAKGFKFFPVAAVVVEEEAQRTRSTFAGSATTDERRVKRGEAEVAATKWRALIEQNASRGKLWAAFGVEQLLRRMWDDGRWQHETPYQEEFELLRHSTDLRIEGLQMRQAHNAVKSSDLGNFLGHSWETASSA